MAALLALAALRSFPDAPDPEPGVPEAISSQDLRAFAEMAERPVFWAGPRPRTRLELTRNRRGSVFIRYLPAGVEVGDRRPAYTTVATYPMPGAYHATARAAQQRGSTREAAPGGGLATARSGSTSVYLAYPGTDALIEVFDPSPARARELVLSGQVGPVR